jgi:hypothetical protein
VFVSSIISYLWLEQVRFMSVLHIVSYLLFAPNHMYGVVIDMQVLAKKKKKMMNVMMMFGNYEGYNILI